MKDEFKKIIFETIQKEITICNSNVYDIVKNPHQFMHNIGFIEGLNHARSLLIEAIDSVPTNKGIESDEKING
jgi:hypothetical protein